MLRAIPLGLVTVTTAGTSTPITAALIAAAVGTLMLPPSGGVHKIEAYPKSGNSGVVYVKVSNGVPAPNTATAIVADLQVPANGVTGHWALEACGNSLNPFAFSLDVATSGDGAYVTLWVE